ncbi:hypothetical protein Ancab_039886 [Ancistrocladus abbreviatus]
MPRPNLHIGAILPSAFAAFCHWLGVSLSWTANAISSNLFGLAVQLEFDAASTMFRKNHTLKVYEDLYTRKKIGGSCESSNLYYLDEPVLHVEVALSEECIIQWHHCLGHPPVSILCHFVSIKSSSSHFNCDAC